MVADKLMGRSGWLSGVLTVGAMVGVCVAARLLPHPPNMTPVAAMALFAGATMAGVRLAVVIPLAAMVITDLVIGMHALAPVVYAAILGNVLLGRWVRHSDGVGRVVSASFAGSVLFFLVTNFGCWIQGYEMSVAGLTRCYVNALPFFGNTVAGDLLFTGVMFGAWGLQRNVQRRKPVLRNLVNRATYDVGQSRQ